MSRQLTVSAAFSVLMMASFVLFGGDPARGPLAGDTAASPIEVQASAMPSFGSLLPQLR